MMQFLFKITIIFSIISICTLSYAQDGAWPGSNLGTLSCPSTTTVNGNTSGASTDCLVSSAGDHIYQFTISSNVDVTIDLCSSSYDTQIHLFNLSNGDCDAGSIASNDDNCGLQSSITEGCLSAGDYVVVIEGYSGNEGAYSMDITTSNCSSCPSTGTGADAPWPGSDLGTIACGGSTSVSDNTTGMNSDCSVSSAGDHIYEFTLSSMSDVTIDVCGASYDTQIHLFDLANGNCNSGAIASSDDNCGLQSSITQTCMTAGSYIVVVEGYSTNEGAYTLNISTTCASCTPPANDDCGGAYSTTVNTDGTCNGGVTAGTVEYATSSSQSSAACAGTEDDDVWFSFVAPSSGEVEIDLQNIAGSTSDLYHSVWSGSCPSLSLVSGSCSDPNTSTIAGLTPGQTYFVRVYSYTSSSGQNTTFDLCIKEVSPCGNLPNNDYCSDPAVLTQGGSGWSSSTTNTYSADTPANTGSVFCGSVENNSWYIFTAQSTTETFDFTTVNNCTWGDGIQAEVYEVSTDADGCCTALSSMSNCWNPATATSGTVTATGLTVGNEYYLMVDGYAGDNCDFTVADWEATGILPVEIISFEGIHTGDENILSWTTASEENNDYFILEFSENGLTWTEIAVVDGSGTTSEQNDYSFIHRGYISGINYYRLKQFDYDGKSEKHGIISIDIHKNKNVLKRINMLGQEVDENFKGIVIIYYSDGSISKVLQ